MDNPGTVPTESSRLWKRHGRSSFVAEDQKRRYKLPERGGGGEWLYKDNVANEFRTLVHSTQRHVTLPALVYKFPSSSSSSEITLDSKYLFTSYQRKVRILPPPNPTPPSSSSERVKVKAPPFLLLHTYGTPQNSSTAGGSCQGATHVRARLGGLLSRRDCRRDCRGPKPSSAATVTHTLELGARVRTRCKSENSVLE